MPGLFSDPIINVEIQEDCQNGAWLLPAECIFAGLQGLAGAPQAPPNSPVTVTVQVWSPLHTCAGSGWSATSVFHPATTASSADLIVLLHALSDEKLFAQLCGMPPAQVTVDRHPASQAVTAHGAGGPGSGPGSVPPAAAPFNLGMLGGLVSLLDNQGPGNSSSDPRFEINTEFQFTTLTYNLRINRNALVQAAVGLRRVRSGRAETAQPSTQPPQGCRRAGRSCRSEAPPSCRHVWCENIDCAMLY